MRVMRLGNGVGDGQLDLMRPQPPGLVARREAEAAPEMEKDGRGLTDQRVAILEEGRREGRSRGRPIFSSASIESMPLGLRATST